MGESVVLKSIEIQGFKTFPEKTVLNFNDGITAIVGPNGSGKSNISDAVRWVMGEQSVKTIRCSKMEDVIFNGTAQRKAKGFASVNIVISNMDRCLPIDEDEIFITRKLYRSGESEYLINKKEVRLKDIFEIFMDTGLGKDGYSMISQGKIDSIVASKSEDRREIFEEAAGISKYKYRRTQAQKKLEQTEENLLRLYDIFKELNSRLEPLKEQAKKAKLYIELAERKKNIEIGLWLNTLKQSGDILHEYDNKITICKSQYDEIESNLEGFNVKINEFSKNIFNRTSCIDETRRKISYCDEDIIKKTGQISVLQNDILHNKENIDRISQEILLLGESLPFIENSLTEKNQKLACLNESLSRKNIDLKNIEQALKNLSGQISVTENKSKELSSELTKFNQLKAEIKIRIMSVKANLEDLNSRKDEIEQNENLYKKKISDLEKTLSLLENFLNGLKNKMKSSDFKIKNMEENLRSFKQTYEKLKEYADSLSLDAETTLRKIHLLEEMENNLEGFSNSVKFLIRSAEKNILQGIHGPVSKLISVSSEFSVAIETALGATLQNIIVDTEEHAKKAISLLKEKKIGRATFLPISNIKGFFIKDENLKSYKGFVGVASQLCSCKAIYKNILDFLLGRIIVVDNIENATITSKKLAYKFKIVTLDGQVVNLGGSLTGGALNKNYGVLNRKEQIKSLKKEYEELKSKVKKAKDDYFKMKNKLSDSQKILDDLNEDNKKIKLNYYNSDHEYQKGVIELYSLKDRHTKFAKERADITKKIENLNVVINDSKNEIKDVEDKIKTIEESLTNIDLNKNDSLTKKSKLDEKFNALQMDILSTNKDIETLSYEINSIIENKKLKEEQNSKLLAELESISLKNVNINTQIDQMNIEIKTLKNRSEELRQNIDIFSKEKINLESEITQIRNSERSFLNEKEKIALEISRLEDKKINLQKDHDSIIAKLWDEYELTRREAMANFKVLKNSSEINKNLNELKLKIKNLGMVNVAAVEEYKQLLERYEFMKNQINDVEKSKKELYKLINELTIDMKKAFSEKFKQINKNFSQAFRDLFDGGNARLELTNDSDILNTGIEIYVQPPGKIVTHLEALSGGERALVAIALYFAIMRVNPPAFCVLDEIDAALDDVNVDKFASYLKNFNKNTQFIIISHRRGTMEEADTLYGVTMQNEGVSKLLELRTKELAKNFVS